MSVTDINPESRLSLARESAVVAISVFGAYDVFVQCLRSVLEHTPQHVPILIADDASPDPAISRFVHQLEETGVITHTVYYLRQPANVGFVQNMNVVFELTDAADVISLNSDCVVAAGWFESLRDAAYSDSLVATASTLTNHGTILSIPHRNNPQPILPQEWPFEQAADLVRSRSPRLHPQIPTGIGHCLYIRRTALDLVGGFDDAFSPGYGEEVDFCQRCVLGGLKHVVADGAVVLHHGMGSFGAGHERNALQSQHDAIISNRYPFYDKWVNVVAGDDASPLARSLTAASVALRGLSVTIDGRILSRFVTGTQIQTLELISALSKRGIAVRVVVPGDLGDYARRVLEGLPVAMLETHNITEATERTDVIHRPYQVSSDLDLPLLNQLGDRLVITHLDLISYFNPSYHATFEHWWDFRRLTELALGMADEVIFISRHAARSAVADGIVDPSRASVVYLGTDHTLPGLVGEAQRPKALASLDSRPFLLYLGTDFRHKNRRFALRLLEELRERHRWDGALVLAGPHVPIGSSAGEEAEYLTEHPDLNGHVAVLGAVDEAEKAWLYNETAGVLYPTVHEGFGLLPFEAAEAGVPCLFAAQSSLAELLPSELALLERWDPEASADRAIGVLTDGGARSGHVRALKAAGASLSWDRTAREVAETYERVVAAPFRDAKTLRLEFSRRAAQMEEWMADAAQFDRTDRLLVGPNGALPPELRRAVLGIANRRFLRALLFGPLLLGYRLVYFLKHRGGPPKQPSPGA